MHHYTYKITDGLGNFYIGSRTSYKPPTIDKYTGSGVWVKFQKKQGVHLFKEVLGEFKSRREACDHEISLIEKHIKNEWCRNLTTASSIPPSNWVNPFKSILNDGFLSRHSKSLLIWMEIVARDSGFGISNRFLALNHGISTQECDSLLATISAELPQNLPQISQHGNIWKLNK